MLDVEISRHQTRVLCTFTLCTIVISVGHDLPVDTVSKFKDLITPQHRIDKIKSRILEEI